MKSEFEQQSIENPMYALDECFYGEERRKNIDSDCGHFRSKPCTA